MPPSPEQKEAEDVGGKLRECAHERVEFRFSIPSGPGGPYYICIDCCSVWKDYASLAAARALHTKLTGKE